jgi:molecular chaperone HtpG
MTTDSQDTFAFSADISQLLSLIINTFYSNKDIFLRELVSNASDALDKIRYQSLTDQTVLNSEKELKIQITCDKENNSIIIRDTGIGMTKNDLINNLGTIAKSGTKSFMEAVSSGKDIQMIGQFGVGFYAAYLVADKVTVYSKHNDDDQYVWESNAGGSFTVKVDDQSERLTRGTKIVLQLKDGMSEYLETSKITTLIKKHSEFITFPIYLSIEKSREEEFIPEDDPPKNDVVVEDDSQDEDVVDDSVKVEDVVDDDSPKDNVVEDVLDDDSPKVEDVIPEKEKKPEKRTVKYNEFDLINNQKPIWACKKDDVTPEQYKAFYTTIKGDYDHHEYSHVEHFSVEGQVEFNSVLFIPTNAPFNMFNNDRKKTIKLYVRRVFITDEYEFLPSYLSFIVGVVDSEDLPLNISREILQENKILSVVKKNLIKRCLSMFGELAKDEQEYAKFFKQYSKNIKLGICEDHANKDKFTKLLRFQTSKSAGTLISFDTYIQNMSENQKNIYYITGDNVTSLENSPFIERLKAKNCEVIFFTDPLDEYVVQHVREYGGKNMICATKDGLKIEETDDEKKAFEDTVNSLEDLTKFVKDILGDKVTKVQISNRLSSSPCILVTSEYGHTANMERIMKSQTMGTDMYFGNAAKVMELNPAHRIVKAIRDRMNISKEDKTVKDLVWLLYDTSLIMSGFSLDDPNKFGTRIHRMVELGLDLDYDGDDIPDLNDQPEGSEEGVAEDDSNMEQVD